ncbi:hypothetical protein [Pseudoduganella rhizocola]|uniref:hypothetical protein n=1 Tax=Pseudoduganella rhizocola TaxID=3382643 RepID=UPI0038B5B27E
MDSDIPTRLAHIEAILPTLATKADIEALRADVARWTLATVIGLFIGFSGLFVAMGNLYMKPPAVEKPTGSTEPPIVIVIPTESLRQKE